MKLSAEDKLVAAAKLIKEETNGIGNVPNN
jgi:hypothetical protein